MNQKPDAQQLSAAWLERFSGIGRLYGEQALCMLAKAHCVIVGIGGVGTWAAEALARSGLGQLTLIDLDDICITNTNRQLHALQSQIGQSKVAVTAERLRQINPEIVVHEIDDFLTIETMAQYITSNHDIVIDAIDMAHTKSCLVAYCLSRKITLVTVGSAGGKQDPSQVLWRDLGRTTNDPLLAKIRRDLYKNHGFKQEVGRKFRIDAIFSTEAMLYPKPDGSVCLQKQVFSNGVKLDCTGGIGSATMVTGTFGFLAASRAIQRFLMKRKRLAGVEPH